MLCYEKYMASNFVMLDKFKGVDFRRWQKNMHFLLSSMSVVYVLTTPIPKDGGDDATMEPNQEKHVELFKETMGSWRPNIWLRDASSKKFTQHKMNMDEAIQVSCIIDKLPPSWKDFKHTLKHLKEELTLVELGSHLLIEESLRVQDSDKPKGNNVAGPSVVNMVEHNNFSIGTIATRVNVNIMITQGLILTRRQNLLVGNVAKLVTLKGICIGCLVLAAKANGSGYKGSVIDFRPCPLSRGMQDMFKDSDLCDLHHATPSLGNKKYFVTFIDDASRSDYSSDGCEDSFLEW
ncbi:hypothetical protein Tco_0195757 [Tanacetum coccineum]